VTKWSSYALAFLLVAALENLLFVNLPVWGVVPIMAPLAVVAVGVLEGSTAGAIFGVVAGVFCDALYLGTSGGMTIACTLMGLFSGVITQSFRASLAGCYICSALSLVALDGFRVVTRLLRGAALEGLLRIAVPEICYSLVLTLPIYLIFRAVYRRVGGDRLA
jgi:cell shape-determining protein MreD